MFVRWQQAHSVDRSKHARERKDGSAKLRAILVESVRADGKPRQRHVAFLASIPRDQVSDDIARALFWDRTRQALDRLNKQITLEDRAHIEIAIAQRVKPLSRAEQEAFERKQRTLLARIHSGS